MGLRTAPGAGGYANCVRTLEKLGDVVFGLSSLQRLVHAAASFARGFVETPFGIDFVSCFCESSSVGSIGLRISISEVLESKVVGEDSRFSIIFGRFLSCLSNLSSSWSRC